MDSNKCRCVPLPSLVVTAPVVKATAPTKTEKVYKEYCPSCNKYIVPDKNDRCPNAYCRWSLR